MSQTPGLLRNTTVLGAARIVERLGNLLVAFFLSRRAGAAGLGTYATAVAYFQLVTIAGEMGCSNLLIREIAKRPERTSSFVVHASAIAVVVSAVAMAGMWALVPHLGYSAELRAGLMVVILAILPAVLNTVQEAVFVAHRRVEYETLTTLASTVVTVAASWVLLGRGHGAVSLLAVLVIAEFAVTLVYFRLVHHRIAPLRLELRAAEGRALLRDLRPFAGSSLLGGIFSRPEIIILSLLATEAQVGYYTGALKLVDLWQFAPQVYMLNVFPVLSRATVAGAEGVQGIQDRALGHLLAVGLPLSAGLAFAARPIVEAFYGPGFGPAVVVLRLLAANVCLYCVHSVLWRVLAARGEQGRVLRIQVVSLAVRLALNVVLIARFGAPGAAVAMFGGLALHCGLLARAVARDGTRVPLLEVAGRFAAAAAVMGIAVGVLGPLLALPLLVGAATVLYGAGALAFGALGLDDLRAVRRLVPLARRTL